MPWDVTDAMSLREEFVLLALQEGANRRELCRRYGISPQTGYKWLQRHEELGLAGLADRSRRPHTSPQRTDVDAREAVLTLRAQHPAWGARKLSRRLADIGHAPLASSTVHSILHNAGVVDRALSHYREPWKRFEHERPNSLWQADFKGHFPTLQGRCSPLTVLDDHSRYNLTLHACRDTTRDTVQAQLMLTFQRYGLPARMNFDNGAPWGSPAQPGQVTGLGLWLIQLGIGVSHSRPYHPQTNGKDERFHRSLDVEVLRERTFASYAHVQADLDAWRWVYNHERPHQALQMATPITRYQPSPRAFPTNMPAIEYADGEVVKRVNWNGELRFRGQRFKLSSALSHRDVAVREPPDSPGRFDVYFAHHRCQTIDLHPPQTPS